MHVLTFKCDSCLVAIPSPHFEVHMLYVIPISVFLDIVLDILCNDISDQVHQLVLTLFWCILICFVGSVFLKDPFIAPFFTSPIRFSANPTTLDTCNPLANSQCAPGHLLQPRAGTASKRVPLGPGSRPLPFNVWMQWYREIYGNFAVWIILNHKV